MLISSNSNKKTNSIIIIIIILLLKHLLHIVIMILTSSITRTITINHKLELAWDQTTMTLTIPYLCKIKDSQCTTIISASQFIWIKIREEWCLTRTNTVILCQAQLMITLAWFLLLWSIKWAFIITKKAWWWATIKGQWLLFLISKFSKNFNNSMFMLKWEIMEIIKP
jgi:hypothetical protein